MDRREGTRERRDSDKEDAGKEGQISNCGVKQGEKIRPQGEGKIAESDSKRGLATERKERKINAIKEDKKITACKKYFADI